MAISPRPQVELEKTYSAAADHYGHPAVSFWDRYGRRTVDRLPLISGMAVLDVCCGMGASATPAAERVGPAGHVIAVDLAGNLLKKGSQRAAEKGLTNIEFRRGDLESLPFPDRTFDAVLCVFGIFFVTDVKGAVRELWRLVRPNGLLAITIWGRGLFEPADGIRRIRNSIGRSNHGARSLSPIRSGRSCSSAVCLTLKSWPSQGGIHSGRRRTGGQSSWAAATDPLSMPYLPQIVNGSGSLRSMERDEQTFDRFGPMSYTL
jgi:SAM-dependent methyltransferase